ncbi:MAG: hypothetical protein KDD35_01955 [Bdellovibrionales bacterium]|nr:hypothetical protein [Bdellovibrionales bacterium]
MLVGVLSYVAYLLIFWSLCLSISCAPTHDKEYSPGSAQEREHGESPTVVEGGGEDSQDKTPLSVSVKESDESHLLCPPHFVLVPQKSPYTSDAFCLAAYEMKIKGQDQGNREYDPKFVAESRPEGTPWVNIDRDSALLECQALGDSFDLISNSEWQTVAQNLELVNVNWTSGIVGKEMMYRGNTDYQPALALQVLDVSDPYSLTGNSSFENWGYGKEQRRTLTLRNGQVIWDLSGNVGEWVKGELKIKFSRGSEIIEMSELTESVRGELIKGSNGQRIVEEFGPSGIYMGSDSDQYFGLGSIWFWFNRGSIIRGSWWAKGKDGGIFSVVTHYSPKDYTDYIGFRCVKHR